MSVPRLPSVVNIMYMNVDIKPINSIFIYQQK